ncbi:AMP-binding protein [Kordiimonas aestuarii]|uniref:AMP-binding protein n=1 Tax=Kordiimonas aestuarii TaxID=1005925 RepID=UPI0021D02FEA|nr:AMP-binding protein [Kordiimonas aestuarii]
MKTALQQQLLKRLHAKKDKPVFTVVRRSGDNPAIDLTGANLLDRAERMQALWRDICGPGPKTVVLAFSHGELFLSSLIAGLLSDVTIVPVALPRPGSQSDRLRHIVQDCGAAAIFCDADQVNNLCRALTHEGEIALPCPVAGLAMDGMVTEVETSTRHEPVPNDTAGPALIQYTSGSTRMPKGIRIFDDQIIANAKICSDRFRISEQTRFVNWLPHYHDMGLMGGILYPLLRGGYSAQLSPFDMIRKPIFWLKCISDFQATMSGGPAFSFAHCLAHVSDKDCDNLDLSTWVTAFCGAEPIPGDLLPAFRQRFARFGLLPNAVFACYGMAEFTLYAAGERELGMPPTGLENTHPCQLTADTKAGLRIFDPESGVPLPDGTKGEIWLRGGSVGRGYVNLPDDTAATFGIQARSDTANADLLGPWLRTGDLGMIVDDWLYITGRIKDIIIANGMKIASTELEWLASTMHDALNPSAAAAFMTDPTVSGHAVLLIELKLARFTIDEPDRVKHAIAQAVAGEWSIKLDEIRFVPRGKLERTSSGKIRRQAIAAAWREKHRQRQTENGPEQHMKAEK